MNEIATIGSAPDWRAPRWLLGAMPGQEVDASREDVQTALGQARRCLEVASEDELLVKLRESLSVFDLPENWDVQAKPYVDALRDLPADLVGRALDHVVRTYKFKFPKPASIRESVEQELSDRHATVGRLEGILTIGKFKEPERAPKTDAEIAADSEMVAKVQAILRSTAEGLKV